MIIRFFKFTKLPQLIFAVIISILIMLAFIDLNNLIKEFCFLSALILIFFLSLFIISKNAILKSNQYISLGFIVFCGIYFKMPSQISITVSYFFLLLSVRKIYSLKSKKNINKKLFDIGFWFIISVILSPINFLFIITILSGLFIFDKISFGVLLKVIVGVVTASLMVIFFQDFKQNIFEFSGPFSYITGQIWNAYISMEIILNQRFNHWLFASVCIVIYVYYLYNFFGNNLNERNKNLFLSIFFINSIFLVFMINEYSIFLFFPFLVTLVKIISELRDNFIFEIIVLTAIILNSYPFNS